MPGPVEGQGSFPKKTPAAGPSSFALPVLQAGCSVRAALRAGERALAEAGVPCARTDAGLLLEAACGVPALQLRVEGDRPLAPEALEKYMALMKRRCQREPLQYILGEAPFMGRMFRVDSRVLIPRFDTEILCGEALRLAKPGASLLDLCTGSGILAITLALEVPDSRVWAGDLSAPALAVAQQNARRLGAEVVFCQGDLFAPFAGQQFSLIVCNPPYIPAAAVAGLEAEVRAEPHMALAGGQDGLDFYRRIAREAPRFLTPGGWLLLEIGWDQGDAVRALLGDAGFCSVALLQDLQNLDRVVAAQRPLGDEPGEPGKR